MSKFEVFRPVVHSIIIVSLLSLLTACGGGASEALNNINQVLESINDNTNNNDTNNNDTNNNESQMMLSGSVGDGPITGATITVNAADGTVLASTISDIYAGYEVMVPDQATYPYTITATSGIDMVTGAAPDFAMVSVVMSANDSIANINPFSTLIVKTAQSMPGGLTATNLGLANQTILQHLNFGLDTSVVPNPITTPVTTRNVADIVKASEVLAEMIRRTRTALLVSGNNLSADDIISAMATDMTDGVLDGHGSSGTSPLIAATANIVSGQVLVEALSNNLYVNGTWATDLLDNAIRTSLPEATKTTADITITAAMLEQAKTAIGAAQVHSPSVNLTTLAQVIDTLTAGARAVDIEAVLPSTNSSDFNNAIVDVVLLTDTQLEEINTTVREIDNIAAPVISFTASPTEVAYNGTTTLTWASTNAVSCSAIGGWSSTHATSGSMAVGPLTATTAYTLNCINANSQITSTSLTVTVISQDTGGNDPAPDNGGNDPAPSEDNPQAELLNVVSVTASGYDVSRDRFPENAIDGDVTTQWTMLGMPQWITLDLGSPHQVNKTRISFFGYDTGRIYDYTVELSLDNLNWTAVASNALSAAIQWTELTFNPTEAQYIRITLNSANSGSYANIYEIEVYGQNSDTTDNLNTVLTLIWDTNPDNVLGYIVYYGPTADTATTQVSDIPINMAGFDPINPSVEYRSWDDLGLLVGDNICFTLKAYNAEGMSESTPALCSVI